MVLFLGEEKYFVHLTSIIVQSSFHPCEIKTPELSGLNNTGKKEHHLHHITLFSHDPLHFHSLKASHSIPLSTFSAKPLRLQVLDSPSFI